MAAGKLFNPEFYENVVNGGKIGEMTKSNINDLDCNNLLLLTDYIYETV